MGRGAPHTSPATAAELRSGSGEAGAGGAWPQPALGTAGPSSGNPAAGASAISPPPLCRRDTEPGPPPSLRSPRGCPRRLTSRSRSPPPSSPLSTARSLPAPLRPPPFCSRAPDSAGQGSGHGACAAALRRPGHVVRGGREGGREGGAADMAGAGPRGREGLRLGPGDSTGRGAALARLFLGGVCAACFVWQVTPACHTRVQRCLRCTWFVSTCSLSLRLP